MITSAAVLVCALEILGRSPSELPRIELVAAPAMAASGVEGFVRPDSGVITLLTDSEVFERARDTYCEDVLAVTKLASIIAHEEWHVRYGADEGGAYEAQLDALARAGVPPDSALYANVRKSMHHVLRAAPRWTRTQRPEVSLR